MANRRAARPRPRAAAVRGTDAGAELAWQLEVANLVGWEREYRFHPVRRWRCDFAWPGRRLAVEIEGAVWTQGRHTRGSGFGRDMEKYNHLACAGWRLIRVTPDDVRGGMALVWIQAALECTT